MMSRIGWVSTIVVAMVSVAAIAVAITMARDDHINRRILGSRDAFNQYIASIGAAPRDITTLVLLAGRARTLARFDINTNEMTAIDPHEDDAVCRPIKYFTYGGVLLTICRRVDCIDSCVFVRAGDTYANIQSESLTRGTVVATAHNSLYVHQFEAVVRFNITSMADEYSITPLHLGKAFMVAYTHDDTIFMFGGCRAEEWVTDVTVCVGINCSLAPPMPRVIYNGAAVEFYGIIYISGGWTGSSIHGGEYNTGWIAFDAAHGKYTDVRGVSTGPRIQHAMIVAGGFTYVVGGFAYPYIEKMIVSPTGVAMDSSYKCDKSSAELIGAVG